jgi:hypothetical protein
LIAEAVGVRQVVTTAELRDLIAPLKFFWLDVFAGDQAVQTEVLRELGHDAADISWALRFGQVPRMAIGEHGLRVMPAGAVADKPQPSSQASARHGGR